jgi:two-component system OmpR family response regulator
MGGEAQRAVRGRVLIVEDEKDLAWLERFHLEHEGYEVRVALEGRAAIAALRSFRPDVIVLDLMLPHVNGWSVLQRMQELPAASRPKVIVTSAVPGAADRATAQDMGVGRFLPKPFDMDDLVRVVAESLAV